MSSGVSPGEVRKTTPLRRGCFFVPLRYNDSMNDKQKNLIIILIAIIVVASIGYYFLSNSGVVGGNRPSGTGTTTSTIEIAPGVFATVETGPKTGDNPLYLDPSVPKPSLATGVTITSTYSEKDAAADRKRIDDLINSLKKDPSSYINWTDLGMYFKKYKDYTRAEEIWVYLTKAAPKGPDAYISLGDLYMYYIHDNTKAEPMFLKAIEVSPRSVEAYTRIVDFYVTALKDTARADKFITAAIKKYPDMELALTPLLSNNPR